MQIVLSTIFLASIIELMHKSDFKEWSRYTVIHCNDLFTEISVPFSDISDCLLHTNSLETWLLEVIYLNLKSSLQISTWLHGIWASHSGFLEDTVYYMTKVNRMFLFLWPGSLWSCVRFMWLPIRLCSLHMNLGCYLKILIIWDFSTVYIGLWSSTPD